MSFQVSTFSTLKDQFSLEKDLAIHTAHPPTSVEELQLCNLYKFSQSFSSLLWDIFPVTWTIVLVLSSNQFYPLSYVVL